MSDPDTPERKGGGRAAPGSDAAAGGDSRQARLEKALRENLRRRKAQSRARADGRESGETDRRGGGGGSDGGGVEGG